MIISLCLALSLMRVDVHWNRPQSQFLTTKATVGGPAQYIDFEGAVRAGKSTPAVAKLARYAIQYPGIHMAAARWTQDGLDAQIKPLWRTEAAKRGLALQWHSDEEYDEVLATGARVYLRALRSSEESMRYGKLAGLTLAILWIDQPEEIGNSDEDVVLAYLPARLSQVGYPHEAWFTPNPVGSDHWLGSWFPEDDPRPNYHLIQTSIYDNRHVLGDAYIADMEDRHPEGTAFRMRFVDGRRGLGLAGNPVYAGYFQKFLRQEDRRIDWHVRATRVDPRFPVYEGWDFGYSHPAVLWTQSIEGQWRVLAEYLGKNQGLADFADAAVELRGRLFPNVLRFESVGDPAGFAKGAGLQGTVADLLASRGIYLADYETVKGYNVPDVEFNAIQRTMQILRSSVHGQPALIIDKTLCPNFALGMEAGYVWSGRQLAGSRGSVKVPEKQKETEYHHLQDCWLYTLQRFGSASMTVQQAQAIQARQAKRELAAAQKDTDAFRWNVNGGRLRGGYR